jgi:peroxiredoxin
MKNIKTLALTVLLVTLSFQIGAPAISLAAEHTQKADKSLQAKLKEMAEASKNKLPAEKKKIMESAIEQLRTSHVVDHALKVGDKMSPFQLPDVKRGMIHSSDLLKKGPLVIVFYRGGWCPYCNLQLHDLQAHLSEIEDAGAQLVAISPQTPDSSLSTVQKDELSFFVLSDVDSKVAKKFHLVYKLPTDLKNLYKEFGIDLEKSNNSKDWELPLSATYIVRPNGVISYAFLDADYKVRAETKDVILKLKELKK